MNSQTFPGDRSDLRVIVYALALLFPPLLAYNRTPSATQLNELLCVLGWGLCLLAANRIPHGAVRRVFYPFLDSFEQQALARRQMANGGTLVAFDLGSKSAAFAFLNALQLVDISNNLGDAKSLITHPATTTHRTLPDADKAVAGITPGLVRLSVGLESRRDLAQDINRALDIARTAA